MAKDRILITGAGGMIAPELADRIADQFDIRMSDRDQIETPYEFVQADLTDPNALARACRGIDALIHLGAATWEYDVREIMIPSNIIGTYNMFDAAQKAGIKKIVFASSHHTVGFHHMDGTLNLGEEVEPRPDTFYAVTKLYGEALGRYYSEKFGIAVYCLRIGYYMTDSRIQEGLTRTKEALVLSAEDFASMVDLALSDTKTQFGIFNCISNAREPWLSTLKAQRILGYEPRDSVDSVFGPDARAEPTPPDGWKWLFESADDETTSPEH